MSTDPSILKLVFGFIGIVFVISYLMALNDYFDAEIDKQKDDIYALAEIPKRLAITSLIFFLFLGARAFLNTLARG